MNNWTRKEFLKVNEVNTDTSKTVLGPMLKLDRTKELFAGVEEFVTAANKSPLLKREGRGAFKIPVIQARPQLSVDFRFRRPSTPPTPGSCARRYSNGSSSR